MRPRILVFDPDVAITQQLFWTLCDHYDVVTANNLHTALRRAATYEPTVVVVDLSPDDRYGGTGAGLRLIEYVKSRSPKCGVLGLRSEVLPASKQKCLKVGVDELIEKPFDTEQLIDRLRQLAPKSSLDPIESGAFNLCY